MEQQKIQMFIMSQGSNLPAEKLPYIRERLQEVDDSKWPMLLSIQFKNPVIVLVLSIFLGSYGVDRFYLGDTGMGIGKLLTCGGCGIWTIIDWFLITNATKEKNFELLQRYLY